MSAVTREQLHAMIDNLTEDDLAGAETALAAFVDPAGREDDGFDRAMLAEGFFVSVPPPLTDEEHRAIHGHPPVEIRGEPVSDTIVRGRGKLD
jgi:hypothetical protein